MADAGTQESMTSSAESTGSAVTRAVLAGLVGAAVPVVVDCWIHADVLDAVGHRLIGHLGLACAAGGVFGGWTVFWATRGGLVARMLAVGPMAGVAMVVALQLFSAGQLRNWSLGGLVPVVGVTASAFGLALAWEFVRRAGRRRLGRIAAAALVAGLLIIDRRWLIGTHAPLHDLLRFGAGVVAGWLAFSVGACSVGRARWHGPLALALLAGSAFLGMLHVQTWLEASGRIRHVFGAELETGRTLGRWFPFPRPEEAPVHATRLSEIERRWREAVEVARADVARRQPVRRNVIIVSVDAVRADACGWLGGTEGATPFLDGLARTSHVFTSTRSPSVTSFYSIAAMLTGRYPSGIQGSNGELPPTLADHLRDQGYWTGACIPPAIFTTRDASWPAGDESLGFERTKKIDKARKAVDQLLSWTAEAGEADAPFCLWAHVMDPHHPYDARERAFGQGDRARWLSEVAHVDAQLEQLWKALDENKLLNDTVVVFTADHGEEFMEHGFRYHGGNVYDVQCHVPLLIHAPWVPTPPAPHSAAISLVSLPATVADLLGKGPIPTADAASLVPMMTGLDAGEDLAAVVEFPVPSQFVGLHPLRAVVTGRWKIVHDLNLGVRQLFDLSNDPGETHDLASSPQHASVLEMMTARERAWRGDVKVIRERRGEATEQSALSSLLLSRVRAGNEDALRQVLKLLSSPDEAIRRAASNELLDAWCRFATRRLPNLARQIEGSGQDAYVAARLDAVDVLLGARPVDTAFVDLLASLEPARARTVARAMLFGREHLRGAAEALVPALASGRLAAADLEIRALLVLLGQVDVAEPLWARLDTVKDVVARGITLRALASIPGDDAWRRLTAKVKTNATLRRALIEQIDVRNDGRHRAWAMQRSGESNGELRAIAADRLAHLRGRPAALAYARRAVWADENPQVRLTVARRLLERHADDAAAMGDVLKSVGVSLETRRDVARLWMGAGRPATTTPDAVWRPGPISIGPSPVELIPAGALQPRYPGCREEWMAYVLCDPAKGTIVVTHGDGELAVPLSGDEPVLASVMRPPTQGPSGAVHAKVTPADASSVTVRGVLLVRNVMPPGLAAAGRATAFTAPYGCAVAHGAFHASQEDGVVWVTGDKAGFMMWSPPPVSRLTMTWKVAPADGVTVEVDNAMLTSDDTGLVRTYALPRRTEDDGIWSINIHAPANARAGGDAPSEARAGVSGLEIR